jgi:DNA-binding NarL/FixJ family response regulator
VLAAQRAAAGLGLPARTGQALRAAAALELARGDAARAAETARAAARHSHQAGNLLDAARSHLLAGRALAAAGRPKEAAVALSAALHHEDSRRLHAEAALELRRLGRRVARQGPRAPRPERGVEALTQREREIVALIGDGLTNRGIAARLHLSPKTVETHVPHVFAKLGVRSRAAAVSAFAVPATSQVDPSAL